MLLALLSTVISHAEVPQLFRARSFNAADLAKALNHYAALGEELAVWELSDLAPAHQFKRDNINKGFSLPDRVGWVCRILFQPRATKRSAPLATAGITYHTMPLRRWPLYPLAASVNSFFGRTQRAYHGA